MAVAHPGHEREKKAITEKSSDCIVTPWITVSRRDGNNASGRVLH
jgi:hypothetical protein